MRYKTPYHPSLLENPLFIRERSLLPKRLNPYPNLRHHTVLIYLLTCVIGVGGWFLLWAHWLSEGLRQSMSYWANYFPGMWNSNLLGILILASLILSFAIDLASASGSTSLINSEVNGGRWDLLRLTLLEGSAIGQAKYAIAQLRVWRITNFVMALRVLVLILLLFTAVLTPFWNEDIGGWSLIELVETFFRNPIELLLGLIIILVIALTYVIEPYWRMKALTAGGLLISTYTRRLSFSLLGGLMVSAGIVISQILLVFAFGYVLSHITPWIPYNISPAGSFFIVLIIILMIAGAIFLYYRTVQRRLIRRVEHRIKQKD